jgi:NADPH-dependent 2,4-dienoyl-CoA reductase/sulfur reductase-like enzyme
MTVASGLVDGAGDAGAVAALALARAGLDVTLAAGGAAGEAALDVTAALRALGEGDAASAALEDLLRERGIEVRPEARLVGSVVIDRHIEVELSDGRVENHDIVVVVGGGVDAAPWQILASDSVPHPAAVDDAIAALGVLAG